MDANNVKYILDRPYGSYEIDRIYWMRKYSSCSLCSHTPILCHSHTPTLNYPFRPLRTIPRVMKRCNVRNTAITGNDATTAQAIIRPYSVV